MEVIGPDRKKELNHWLETDGVIAGAYTNMDGHMDPSSANNDMAAGARQKCVTIIHRNRVTDINRLPSGE